MSEGIAKAMSDLYGNVSFGGGGGVGGSGGGMCTASDPYGSGNRGSGSNVSRRTLDVVNNYGSTMGALGYGVVGAGAGGTVAGPAGALIGGAVGAAVGGIVGSISQGYAEDRAGRRCR